MNKTIRNLAIAAVFCLPALSGFSQEVQQDETPAVQHMAEQTVNRFPVIIYIP